ncbi:MAG: hypothetical protein APF76_01125 [Desulfitibacter sp. BRH_c19]|nr:MAG: hypothetical protein APF76_01125 [Desulfitibacter sp. BRH_c19]
MFKKVLVCTDLSETSNVLISCAGDLKSIGVQEVILAHIDYKIPISPDEEVVISPDNPLLKEQQSILQEAGLNTTIESVHGIPAHTINLIAEKHNVSAIVIGSHGKGILKRTTIGSVSGEVLNLAKKPVLLVRVKQDKTQNIVLECKQMSGHILYLTDFSSTAEKALNYVEKLVQETKCPVSILHVQNYEKLDMALLSFPQVELSLIEKIEKQKTKEIQTELQAIKNRLEKAGSTSVDFDFPEGRAIDVVIDTIKNKPALSLVVMGSQGKGFVSELFMGSLSLQVTRYSPIPVMLIPAST